MALQAVPFKDIKIGSKFWLKPEPTEGDRPGEKINPVGNPKMDQAMRDSVWIREGNTLRRPMANDDLLDPALDVEFGPPSGSDQVQVHDQRTDNSVYDLNAQFGSTRYHIPPERIVYINPQDI